MRSMDGIERDGFLPAPPIGEAAIKVLDALQALHIPIDGRSISSAEGSPSAWKAVKTSRSDAAPIMREASCSVHIRDIP